MRQLPLSIVWIRRLLLFRLILMATVFAAVAFVLFVKPTESWLTRFVYIILKRTGNGFGNGLEHPAYVLYYLLGFYMFSVLFILLEYYCVVKKRVIGFWVAFALDVLSTLIEKHLPVFPLLILILGTRKTAQSFFKGRTTNPNQNILDDEFLS